MKQPILLPAWTIDWEAWRGREFLHEGSLDIQNVTFEEAQTRVRHALEQLFPKLYPGAEIVFTSPLTQVEAHGQAGAELGPAV